MDILFLQYRGYKVIWAILGEQAVRALAPFLRKMLGVLAVVAIPILAARKATQDQEDQSEASHFSFPFRPV